jgi:hypothetical protein
MSSGSFIFPSKPPLQRENLAWDTKQVQNFAARLATYVVYRAAKVIEAWLETGNENGSKYYIRKSIGRNGLATAASS